MRRPRGVNTVRYVTLAIRAPIGRYSQGTRDVAVSACSGPVRSCRSVATNPAQQPKKTTKQPLVCLFVQSPSFSTIIVLLFFFVTLFLFERHDDAVEADRGLRNSGHNHQVPGQLSFFSAAASGPMPRWRSRRACTCEYVVVAVAVATVAATTTCFFFLLLLTMWRRCCQLGADENRTWKSQLLTVNPPHPIA